MAERKSPICRKDSDELPRRLCGSSVILCRVLELDTTGPSGQKSFLSVLNSRLEWTYAENKIEKDGTGFKASPKYLNGEGSAEGRDQAQR